MAQINLMPVNNGSKSYRNARPNTSRSEWGKSVNDSLVIKLAAASEGMRLFGQIYMLITGPAMLIRH